MNCVSTCDLSNLVLEAREYPIGSIQRQRLLTEIIRRIQRSKKIWFDPHIPLDHYQEALQHTWMYFCQNLQVYDPTRANPVTWFNCVLKFRIMDVRRKHQAQEFRVQRNFGCDLGAESPVDLIDRLPAPELDGSAQMLEELLNWLEENRSNLEQKSIRNHAEINVYTLMMRRLPTEQQMSWQVISDEFGISVPTLSSFYQRQCIPILKEFGTIQGWFDDRSL
jgi:DNA-directed RNA polymerase specialized sigma24 family protein